MPLLSFSTTSSAFSDEEKYLTEWQNSSRLLFYSVVVSSFLALPILFLSFLYVKCYRKSHFLPYLCSILIANFILLSTLFISVITENTDMIYDTIPGFLVCKVTAFLVNSSSCFIHWSWVAMYAERFFYIFFPFRIHVPNPQRSKIILTSILIFSLIIQIWTPIFITGRRVDNQFDNIYCGEDPEYSNDFQSRIIMVLECLGTFFIPLILTILADISVLMWNNSCSEGIQMVANDEIRKGESRKNSHWKIVSSNSLRNSKKRRSLAIRRCLMSATITLFLNLPNYSLQLLDEFLNLKDSPNIDTRRVFLRIDAFVYILYLMQFPITPIHIFFLSRTTNRRNSKNNQSKGSLRADYHHATNLV